MLKIFVNTWGNYNSNGADGGEWIELPMDEDELEEKLQMIASNMDDEDPEFAIHDYEWTSKVEFGSVGEMDSIVTWNELCNEADALDEDELEGVAAAIEAFGYSFREALDRQQRGCFTFYPGQTLTEVAEMIVDECYELPEFAMRYFDYEAFARDLDIDGYTETDYGVICDN